VPTLNRPRPEINERLRHSNIDHGNTGRHNNCRPWFHETGDAPLPVTEIRTPP
jgi:hypothetical protein